jgi:hypothetical protein
MNALAKIQAELKAPKNQKNSFGGYNYRSCEDILEAVKPLLKKHDACLTISDIIEEIGGRIYVKATVKFEGQDGCHAEVTAYAREAETKKGMDESQITGAASSYARKYALNGLFLIDDTKDADTNGYAKQQKNAPQQRSNGNDPHKEHYKTISTELDGAFTPSDVDGILKNRAAWLKAMPKAGAEKLKEIAAARRVELGGEVVNG